ncbi:restriction endonuclease subunit S [Janthinobacterium sp. PC23-8]|uniref:restriction endonuclease subunit S n=1 Tax=Janthinobacterium sp. PC23-8 TaxID=2012679 RepID=UPI000B95E028|nr:restriction endonuclease subunit S [Janthinobacterium sp. PC23-8]OYO31154.1 hypothetical protein CD932_08485 [Janthinobacterium sp. PC23-8]
MSTVPLSLDSVCDFIVDCEHKTAPIQKDGYPSIRTPNIGRGRLNLEGVNRVSEETYIKWTRRGVPRYRDLIFSREAPVGNIAIIPRGIKVCLGQRTVHIRPNARKIHPEYLLYLLLGDEIQGRFKSQSNGSTVHHLNLKDIRGLILPTLPSSQEQFRIAEILSTYDDLIENNARRITILKEMARRIYEEWFVNFQFPGHKTVPLVESELGPVPEGWDVETLDKALVLQRGFDLPAGDRNPGQFPIIAASGVIAYHTEKRADGPGVVTGRSGTIGKVMYVTEDFWPLNTALWVKEFVRVSPLYGFHMLSGIDFSAVVGGAAVPTLNRNHVHAMKIAIPPEEMVIRFDQAVDPLQKLARNLELKNINLRQTRDLLLPRLISGELDVSTMPMPGDMAA